MGRAARNPDTGLTDKEEIFCEKVAFNPEMNASDAYRAAYNTERMKPETVNRKASELVNKGTIRARIAQLREERIERTKTDADWVLKRLVEEAEADLADIINDNGGLKPLHEWPLIWRQGLVTGLEIKQEYLYQDGEQVPDGYLVKAKLADRSSRIKLIGDHINVQAFKQQVGLNLDGLADALKKARQRAKLKP